MYPNVASSFIMSFVSPIPSFSSAEESNYRRNYGVGNSYGSPDSSVEENDESSSSGSNLLLNTAAQNMSAICESYLMMSGAAGGNGSARHPPFLSEKDIGGTNEEGGSWETGQDEWTLGRHMNSDNSNYHQSHNNNPFSQLSHNYRGISSSSSGATNYGGEKSVCPVDWDNILCWPKTVEGEIATLPCFDTLHGITYNASGFAKRLCMEGGIWNKTEYSGCKPFTPMPNITTDTGNLDITTGIYLFGYSLSLVALIIAAVIIISFKELRCLRNTIHSNLMVTYVLADALWVLSVISTDQERNRTQATCWSYVLLHYFHLTNFFWMFIEGLYLYVLVVQTFMTESIRLRTYCLIGWGLPLLIVLLWSVTKWATLNISAGESTEKTLQVAAEVEFNSVVCPWLHANHYDWIYISSALLVLAANLVFLLQIMWVLITKLRSATSQEAHQSRKAAKALVVLMPLLGITYVLVLIGPKKWPLFEHTRAFLLSTQGFLVALLYCFLNSEVRMAIRHRWNRMECLPAMKCCQCCRLSDARQNVQNLRDWSPRSRTESIRLYAPNSQAYRKRESNVSETTTTMTALGCGSLNGNGNTTLITSMKDGRRISTTPLRPSVFTEESDMV